jgi:flagellar basal body-associated protein FliL
MSEAEKKPEQKDAAEPKAQRAAGRGTAVIALAFGVLNLGATAFVALEVKAMPRGEHEVTHVDNGAPGQLAALDTFVVNLDEQGSPRYLKASMSIELSADPEALNAYEQAKHKIRDLFLRYLSSLDVQSTRGDEGKLKIREELLARAQEELGKDRVKDLFFGEFVVQ